MIEGTVDGMTRAMLMGTTYGTDPICKAINSWPRSKLPLSLDECMVFEKLRFHKQTKIEYLNLLREKYGKDLTDFFWSMRRKNSWGDITSLHEEIKRLSNKLPYTTFGAWTYEIRRMNDERRQTKT